MTRAGFWRRLGALLVDCIMLTAIVPLAAIVLYPLSDGKLQAHGLVRFIACQPTAELPAGVVVPPEYDATSVKACRINLLGLEYGHYLEAERSKTSETDSDADPWVQRIDRSGAGTSVFPLDVLILPLLMLWRAVGDGRSGQTLGRRAVGLTVTSLDGGQPGFGRALLRQVLLWWPSVLSLPIDPGATLSGGFQIPAVGFEFTTSDILGLTALIWYVTAIVMIVRRTDPLYDRWAGTKVVAREVSGS